MNIYIKKIILLLVFVQTFIGVSQQDTIFWFAAPDVSSIEGELPIHLNLSTYSNPAIITVDQPANIGFVPIVVNLAANSTSIVDLTPFLTDIESSGADFEDTTGIRIVSTELISASYEILNPTNRELFSLKGIKEWERIFIRLFKIFGILQRFYHLRILHLKL